MLLILKFQKKILPWSMAGLLLLAFFHCSKENYIQVDHSQKVDRSAFKSNASSILYTYIINKETLFVDKDDSSVKHNYKLTIEEPEPLLELTAKAFTKIPNLQIDPRKEIPQSNLSSKLKSDPEERFLFLTKAPLLSSSQRKMIPLILNELGKEQMVLARIDYTITENKSFKDQSNLNVSLTALIYNKKSDLVYASEKRKTVTTYLPDDKLSIAYFMGDVLTAAFKGEVNIPVNKHCRPQVYQIVEELWGEIISDLKEK